MRPRASTCTSPQQLAGVAAPGGGADRAAELERARRPRRSGPAPGGACGGRRPARVDQPASTMSPSGVDRHRLGVRVARRSRASAIPSPPPKPVVTRLPAASSCATKKHVDRGDRGDVAPAGDVDRAAGDRGAPRAPRRARRRRCRERGSSRDAGRAEPRARSASSGRPAPSSRAGRRRRARARGRRAPRRAAGARSRRPGTRVTPPAPNAGPSAPAGVSCATTASARPLRSAPSRPRAAARPAASSRASNRAGAGRRRPAARSRPPPKLGSRSPRRACGGAGTSASASTQATAQRRGVLAWAVSGHPCHQTCAHANGAGRAASVDFFTSRPAHRLARFMACPRRPRARLPARPARRGAGLRRHVRRVARRRRLHRGLRRGGHGGPLRRPPARRPRSSSALRPTARTFRPLLPLYPHAIESFDLRGYDTVVSSSSAWAHGVLVDPGAVHVCYCHNPFRYAWTEREATLRARHPLARLAAADAAQPLAPVGLDRRPAGGPLRRELAPDRGAGAALLRARGDRAVPAGGDRRASAAAPRGRDGTTWSWPS